MVPFRSSNFVVSTIAYMFSVLLIVTSDIVVNSSADDGGTKSNLLDIHIEMQSGSSSLDIKSLTRDEIKDCNKAIDRSKTENLEEKSPIAERSTDDQDRLKVDLKLNKLSTQFQAIEKLLQDVQKGHKMTDINEENVCLIETKSLGVHCSTCTPTRRKSSNYPKNCKEVLQSGNNTTGIYEIYPTNAKSPFHVLCDMETKGGGWTHIQKRFDGSQDFFLDWRDYKFGFGDLEGEFWLGLEQIYLLTDGKSSELLVEIVDRDNVSAYAQYSSFGIGPEKNGYLLDRLSGYSGDAGDSLSYHFGEKFSTRDLDFTKDNCGTQYFVGWWYKACHYVNLNGRFINVDLPEKLKYKGLHWRSFRSHEYCHSKSRMLVRPAI